jgi:hypothetical protein
LPDDSQAYRFKIDVSDTIDSLPLDVVDSTGGNTGLVEFGIYAPRPCQRAIFQYLPAHDDGAVGRFKPQRHKEHSDKSRQIVALCVLCAFVVHFFRFL